VVLFLASPCGIGAKRYDVRKMSPQEAEFTVAFGFEISRRGLTAGRSSCNNLGYLHYFLKEGETPDKLILRPPTILGLMDAAGWIKAVVQAQIECSSMPEEFRVHEKGD